MPITIVEEKIEKTQLKEIAKERYGDLVKAVVDVEKGVMIIGAELHSDEESLLLENGSEQKNLWGINLYPHKAGEEFIEFDSVINLRPSHGNTSRGVDDPIIRQKIKDIINQLIEGI